MIVDALLQFSGTMSPTVTGQALNFAPGTYTSTNVIDTAGVGPFSQARDMGKGNWLTIMAEIVAPFAGGTSLQILLVDADDAAISVNVTTITASPVIPLASLISGQQIPLGVDRVEPFVQRRYLAVQYVILGTMTAGNINTFLLLNPQDKGNNTIFQNGFLVS